MKDAQRGWSITLPMKFTSPANYKPLHGDIILEILGDGVNDIGVVPNFSPVNFTNSYYSNGAAEQPFGSANGLIRIEAGRLSQETLTSNINGASFNISKK
jgi:hypothetical protein